MNSAYDIEVEEHAEDGETPETFCVIFRGQVIGPAHGSREEAQTWINNRKED